MPGWRYARDAPMNAEQALELSVALTGLRKYIDGRFPPGPESDGYLSPTGERFVVFGPEIVDEGQRLQTYISLDAALTEARRHFDDYAKDRSGMTYWRTLPEATCYPDGWRFYMRLLISDQPPMQKPIRTN